MTTTPARPALGRARRRGPEFARSVALRLADPCVHATGHERGHADARARDLAPKVFGDRDDRRLRRRVRLAARPARERDDRRGVHDVALGSLREQARHELVQPVDHAEHVHAVHPPPVFDAQLGHLAEHEHARVVAEHVHRAERVVRALGERVHRLDVGHVGLHRERVDALGAVHVLCNGIRGVDLDVGDHDAHARFRERADHPAADPTPATGHHRHLARQIVHPLCLSREPASPLVKPNRTGWPLTPGRGRRTVGTGVPRGQLKVEPQGTAGRSFLGAPSFRPSVARPWRRDDRNAPVGAPGRIRTCDLVIRSDSLCPSELRRQRGVTQNAL